MSIRWRRSSRWPLFGHIFFIIIYLSSSAFQNGPETAAHLMGHLLYSSSAWGCSRQACFCPSLPTSSFRAWSAWRPRSCGTRGFSARFSGLLSAVTYCQPARTGAGPSPCPEKPMGRWEGIELGACNRQVATQRPVTDPRRSKLRQ